MEENIIVTDNADMQQFPGLLLHWNQVQNKRQMPWKGEQDPYRIWLSEIILQQTRVEQGLKYYERFIKDLPTIRDLAAAPEQQVFKLWEGLGYYSRCRNLIATAKDIVQNMDGRFPTSYEGVLALKGVGPYTAAAITSFAYNAPYAVLDGNVFRVLARIFNIAQPVDSAGGKKLFSALAQRILPVEQAGIYNQALMDFGATICKPLPECARCFFNQHCKAFLLNKQAALPVKEKKAGVRHRWFHYFVLEQEDHIAIGQRTAKDIWQGLYELILIESDRQLQKEEALQHLEKSFGIKKGTYVVVSAAASTTQRLTHQLICFSFIHLELEKKDTLPHYQWISKKHLHQFAFPKTISQFLAKNLV
ncbi:MAG TPA: A/G-specific adenine glycosylase [Flavisolibacter sp.]|nr:A/G-specific adenine glycosylase [Flavisolibacter sp.]